MKLYFQQCLRFCQFLINRFIEYGCTYRAAALTFTSLLALVPLMVVSFAVLSAFPTFKDLGQQVQNFIFANFVPASGELIQSYLENFVTQASRLSFIGSAFLLVTAILLLITIEQAFNAIWRVKRSRKGIFAFFVYWAALTLLPILIGVSFAISSYLISLPVISDTATKLGLLDPILSMAPFLLTSIAFTLIYVALPNCRVNFLHALIGGFIAAILFELAKSGFTLYLTKFPTYVLVYGALAAIPIFLIWLYLSWIIILFGALLTNALSQKHHYNVGESVDGFSHVILWLSYLWQAQQQGHQLTERELLKKDRLNYLIDPNELLDLLITKKIIYRTRAGKLVLLRDLNELSLMQLHDILPWKIPSLDAVQLLQQTPAKEFIPIVNRNVAHKQKDLEIPVASIFKIEPGVAAVAPAIT